VAAEPLTDTDELLTLFRRNRRVENADATIDRYVSDITDWVEFLNAPGAKDYDPNDLDRDVKTVWEAEKADLKRYLGFLLNEGGYAPGTVKVRKASISTFYQAMDELAEDSAQADNLRAVDNPADGLELSGWRAFKDDRSKKQQESSSDREISYLEPAEVAELVENVPRPIPRNGLMIKLLYHTGMRRGELSRVELTDVDQEDRRITVDDTKNSQERTAFYPPELDTELNRWINVHRRSLSTAESPYLFPTTHSEQIAPHRINQIVKQAAENAGLQSNVYTDAGGKDHAEVTAHTLRHSFGYSCVMEGMGTRSIQKLMGHAKIETTEVYLQLGDDSLENRYRTSGPAALSESGRR